MFKGAIGSFALMIKTLGADWYSKHMTLGLF
jgi:hypothetical protein